MALVQLTLMVVEIEGNDAKYPDTNPDFRDQGKKSKEAIGIDKLSFGQVQKCRKKKGSS